MPLILIICIAVVIFAYQNRQYKKGAYYHVTKNPYSLVKWNKGKYAEYLTYESLRHFEGSGGRFLFNVLIPKQNGGTTEIDVLLICPNGLFVFESKNYGGWIFGNEAHQHWTQTLPKGRGRSHKERFYNPIMQNAAHIRHLKNIAGQNVPMRSIIVFSDRCTLKNITLKSSNVSVVNRHRVAHVVAEICSQIGAPIYTEADIASLYDRLYPYTQMGHDEKQRHVRDVRRTRVF